MSILFEPIRIRNMVLKNRFVRSATAEACADENGHVTEDLIRIHRGLAEGQVGLIITGITFVHPLGRISPHQIGLAGDDAVPGLKHLAEAVHERGGKIAVQLFHAGRESGRYLNPAGKQALAPSRISDDPAFKREHRAFTEEEIWGGRWRLWRCGEKGGGSWNRRGSTPRRTRLFAEPVSLSSNQPAPGHLGRRH